MSRKKRCGTLPQFTPMLHSTMDSLAWLALSPAAKALYPAMKRRIGPDIGRNGRLAFSVREAAAYLQCSKDAAAGALRDLQKRGFLVATTVGTLGVVGCGKASEFRLTELGTAADPRPTAEFKKIGATTTMTFQLPAAAARNPDPCPESGTSLSEIQDVRSRPCPESGTSCPESRTFQAL